MMKYLVLLPLAIPFFIGSVAHATLQITLAKPDLLLQQISASDVGIQPELHESERQYSALISEKLKNQQYQALLDELTEKLATPLAAEQVSSVMAYLVAQLALQQQKYTLAERYFKQAIKQQPNYGKAFHGLGLVYLKLQQYPQANRHLSKALQLGINDAQLYSYLGYGYLQSNNFHSAVVAYQQAKLFKPDDQQLNQSLLYAYSQVGQSDAALSLLTQMLNNQPNTSALWLHRANVLLKDKNYALAISSLETAIRLGESSPENIAMTAQLHMQHGSIYRAISLYQQSWQQHHNVPLVLDAVAYLISTNQIMAADKWLKALTITPLSDNASYADNTRYSDNTKTKPSATANHSANKTLQALDHSQLLYLKGKVAQLQGKLTIAESTFAQALTKNSINGDALLSAAQVKRELGQSHQAQMLLLRASDIESVKLSALTEHADLMLSLGRYAKALEYLQQALAFAPQESSIMENVQSLQLLVNQSES